MIGRRILPHFRLYAFPPQNMQGMEVINDPDVQAVWVCSPSQFHADQIKAAAKAGKHIFCEKPIATDLKGTIEAVQVSFVCSVRCRMESFEMSYRNIDFSMYRIGISSFRYIEPTYISMYHIETFRYIASTYISMYHIEISWKYRVLDISHRHTSKYVSMYRIGISSF